MLEHYYIRPDTIDRIRASWIGEPIERYVTWLSEQGYAARTVYRRVPVLLQFGEFARVRGARRWEDLPGYVDAFSEKWVREHGRKAPSEQTRRHLRGDARNPVRQMLGLLVPGYAEVTRSPYAHQPFAEQASGFFTYLREERGLRDASIAHYGHSLRRFERYLERIGLRELEALSPPVLSALVTECSRTYAKTTLIGQCSALRVFLRYLHRERLLSRDLSGTVDTPRVYRLAEIPRAIAWDDVRRMLGTVERRTCTGKRDYAILLLLVTYGLRAREVAALTLEAIDWKRERLRVPERKGGHSTAYPLSPVVGEALIDYLRHGRPETDSPYVFFRALAPVEPLTCNGVSCRASYYLHKAGIAVARAGSHTLRHTCVQKLVDAHFSFKSIGDYVGHASADSTRVYAKLAVDVLREVALGHGEDVL